MSFYADGVLLSTDSTSPYNATFSSNVVGAHVLTAKTTDVNNQVVTSAPINVTVLNAPPTVSLTSPTAGSRGVGPATFFLAATAADANDSVVSVKFYADGVLLGTDTAAPFSWQYTTSTIGSHSITAVATDTFAATTTSSAVAVSVVVGVSSTRRYVYDSSERLCKTIDPESGATLVDYDAAGNIAWTAPGTGLTSATCDRGSVTAGQKITRSYDAMNRLLTVVTPGNVADVTTTYTADGKVASLVAANGAAGANPVTTTYSYNKRRMLTQETSAQAGYLYTLGYGYDANGFQSSLTYPDTQVVSFNPDALGRATKVNAGTTNYATAITYFPNGAIAGFSYGNGVIHTMTQNARFLPSRSQDTKGTTKIIDDTYVYDANGNVDYMTDAAVASGATNRNVDLGYDALDRMIVADAPNRWGLGTYGYDSLDNLKLADQGTRQYRYSYDASNRLSQIKTPAGASVFTFTSDARGNVTSKNSTAYAFDIGNRLSAVTGVQSYRYDGQGRRVQTTDANGTTKEYWVYSQSGQVLYTSEARRSQNLSYIYLGNTQVATRAVAWGSGTITLKYEHTDALGSPVVETSSTGVVAKRNTYAPFGEAYAPTSIDGTGYTGHVMDQATGLTYMQQRYYDPAIGAFLSVDPVDVNATTAANFCRYCYANSNPYKFTDPDGRNGVTALGGVLYESAQFVQGNGFDSSNLGGALGDGYDGEGSGFAAAAFEDATTFIPVGVVAGALAKTASVVSKAAPVAKVAKAVAGKITGYTRHGLNQAISREGRGVATKSILAAVKSPAKVVEQAGGKIAHTGADGTRVVLNSEGKVVTVIPKAAEALRVQEKVK